MALEVVTSMYTLMVYSRAVGKARQSGDKEAIQKAIAERDAYLEMCLKSDKMTMTVPTRE